MNYKSTRNSKISVSSAEAILSGLSSDGGLFVPEEFPVIGIDEIGKMSGMDYCARAKKILAKFLTDFSKEEIETCVNGAYGGDKFDCDEKAKGV